MSQPIDVLKLRKGATIILKDGRKLTVRNCYMSSTGVMVTAKEGISLVDQNIPLDQISELKGASEDAS